MLYQKKSGNPARISQRTDKMQLPGYEKHSYVYPNAQVLGVLFWTR
jgi:hypothetical protein